MRRPGERGWQVSTVVGGAAAEDIASRVVGGEVVALASRATWLATESGGVGTVTTPGLQFGTAGVVTAGLVGVSSAVSVAGRGVLAGARAPVVVLAGCPSGSCLVGRWRCPKQHRSERYWSSARPARWPTPLVVAGEPAPAPATRNATIPSERIQRTQLMESLRAVFAGDHDSTDMSVMVDRWCSKARRSRIPDFVKTARTIRKRRDGIDAAIDRGLSNGRQEGQNNKVLLIIRRAYDFHSPEVALVQCRQVSLRRRSLSVMFPQVGTPCDDLSEA